MRIKPLLSKPLLLIFCLWLSGYSLQGFAFSLIDNIQNNTAEAAFTDDDGRNNDCCYDETDEINQLHNELDNTSSDSPLTIASARTEISIDTSLIAGIRAPPATSPSFYSFAVIA